MQNILKDKKHDFIYWTPRVLSLIFIAFLLLMSLDVFGTGLSFLETILALFMHNIPALILAVVLAISWRYEIVGGIAFIAAGLLYIVVVFRGSGDWKMALAWSAQISGAAFVIGGFFIADWVKRRDHSSK